MKVLSRNIIIQTVQENKEKRHNQYHVKHIGSFVSIASDEEKPESDIIFNLRTL